MFAPGGISVHNMNARTMHRGLAGTMLFCMAGSADHTRSSTLPHLASHRVHNTVGSVFWSKEPPDATKAPETALEALRAVQIRGITDIRPPCIGIARSTTRGEPDGAIRMSSVLAEVGSRVEKEFVRARATAPLP